MKNGFSTIKTKLISAYKEVFGGESRYIFFREENGRLLLGVCHGNEYSNGFIARCHQFYEKSKTMVELFTEFDFTLCVSSEKNSLGDFYAAFEEAQTAMHYRLRKGANKIIVYDQIEKMELHFTDEEKKQFFTAIQ